MSNRAQTGDYGHLGHNPNDHVLVQNAHPHAEPSQSYDGAAGPIGTRRRRNHGFASFHVKHDPRAKGAEHHPPAGLED